MVLAREIGTPGERSEFFARVRRREYLRIFRGVYVRAEAWTAMKPEARHRVRVGAASAFAETSAVFSHASAAALWRLPWIGDLPEQAHITVATASGGRSRAMFARHTTGVPREAEVIDGIATTNLARTVVDVARTESFGCAVTVADAALRRTEHPVPEVPPTVLSRAELRRELARVPLRQGVAKARRVIEFADARADRPGESMSRVSMHVTRLPEPVLQVPLLGASGRSWTVDFFWPQCRLIGEFDGEVKYDDPEFLRGRTPKQALRDEKEREDDLRAADFGMSRWGWDKAISPQRLRAHLLAAGLHRPRGDGAPVR